MIQRRPRTHARRDLVAAGPGAIVAIGAIARDALLRSGGVARVLARLTEGTYCTAGAEIVWLGRAPAPLHPRAVVLAADLAAERDQVRLAVERLVPWRPAPPGRDPASGVALVEGWRALRGRLGALGTAQGFGRLLLDAPLAFPLDAGRHAAAALAAACDRDDAAAATGAALGLLGLGPGLTPSGDDYVGGALFGRRLLARAGLADAGAWRSAATAIVGAAAARTHPIGVALLGDLARGESHAPLHDLVAALATGAQARALAAARRLVRLGHSSGWDVLAGLAAGLVLLGGPELPASSDPR